MTGEEKFMEIIRYILANKLTEEEARRYVDSALKLAQIQIVSIWAIPSKTILSWPVKELELSTRAYNALLNNNIHTVGELLKFSRSKFLLMPNFGNKSLRELEEVLEELGLRLGMLD